MKKVLDIVKTKSNQEKSEGGQTKIEEKYQRTNVPTYVAVTAANLNPRPSDAPGPTMANTTKTKAPSPPRVWRSMGPGDPWSQEAKKKLMDEITTHKITEKA